MFTFCFLREIFDPSVLMLLPLSVSIAVDAAFIGDIRPRDKELFLLFTSLFMQKCAIFQPYFWGKVCYYLNCTVS